MKVSIIIPTYNRCKYLSKAIDSALDQNYDNLEVIVSDNASTDITEELVRKYAEDSRFRYFRNNTNLGMVANWRLALQKYATGDFFLILSDDDYLIDNNYILNAVNLIKTDNEIVIVYANGYIYHENSKKKNKLNLPFKEIEIGKNIFLSRKRVMPQDFTLCNILFKRDLALKLKAFSNDYNISCDSELFLKMCLFGKVGIIKDYVSVYQLHQGNVFSGLKNDLKLLLNNMDEVIEPYKLAKCLGVFSKEELEIWENRVLIFEVIYTLSMVMLFQKENYDETVQILKKKDSYLLKKTQKTFKFKMLFILYKLDLLSWAYKFQKKFIQFKNHP